LIGYGACMAASAAMIYLVRSGYSGPVSLLISGAVFLVPVSIATWLERHSPPVARLVWSLLLAFAVGLCIVAAVWSFQA